MPLQSRRDTTHESTGPMPTIRRRRRCLSGTDKANLAAMWVAALVIGAILGLMRAAYLTPTAASYQAPELTPQPTMVITEVTTVVETAPVAVTPTPTRRRAATAVTTRTPQRPHATPPSVARCAFSGPLATTTSKTSSDPTGNSSVPAPTSTPTLAGTSSVPAPLTTPGC